MFQNSAYEHIQMEKNPENERNQIIEACRENGLQLDSRQIDQLEEYSRLLESINSSINLVSRKEDASLLIRHIFHSLLIGFHYPFQEGEKVLDLGTGGGLPGIPLAIAYPKTDFLLIDATGKKINACRQMIQTLGMRNVHAQKIRAEEIKGMIFDVVLSRQVAPLRKLCRYAEKILRPEGLLICLKGGNLEKEIEDALENAKKNNGFPSDVVQHELESFDTCFAEKYIVIACR